MHHNKSENKFHSRDHSQKDKNGCRYLRKISNSKPIRGSNKKRKLGNGVKQKGCRYCPDPIGMRIKNKKYVIESVKYVEPKCY